MFDSNCFGIWECKSIETDPSLEKLHLFGLTLEPSRCASDIAAQAIAYPGTALF
jgi:hypothetical protein